MNKSTRGPAESLGEDDSPWAFSKAPRQKFHTTVGVKRSSRITLGENRGGDQLDNPGTPSPSNPFAILNSIEDEELEVIALESDVILGGNSEDIRHSILSIKLEEMARAKVAGAIYNSQRRRIWLTPMF